MIEQMPPDIMTTEERLSEIASLLARACERLRERGKTERLHTVESVPFALTGGKAAQSLICKILVAVIMLKKHMQLNKISR